MSNMDLKIGPTPMGNENFSLNLLQTAVHIHKSTYHTRDQSARELLRDISTDPRFVGVGGVYLTVPPSLNDGEAAIATFTSDGRLRTDASITVGALTVNVTPTQWTKRFYAEVDVTNADSTITFLDVGTGLPFSADEITVANDDNTNSVWLDYNGAAVADTSHDKVLANEKFVDKVVSGNVHLITNVAGPIKVRVWARAQ